MQHRETTVLWNLMLIQFMWSLDTQLLLKIFMMHTLQWQQYEHLKSILVIYEKQMPYKPYFPTLQPSRESMYYHSEVVNLFFINPVLPTMKSKLNLPLVYNDAGSESQHVRLIVSGLLNERKNVPLLKKKAGYFYLCTAFQTTGFKRVAYRTYFPSTGYEQFLSIMYGSYRHPGEREQGPKCPGRCKSFFLTCYSISSILQLVVVSKVELQSS